MLTFYTQQNHQLVAQTTFDATTTVWVDMLNPTLEEDKQMEALLGLNIPTQEDMGEIELSARLYHEDNSHFMTALLVADLEGELPHKAPVTFIIKNHALITVRYSTLKAFENFLWRAQRPQANLAPDTASLLLNLLESSVARIADGLEKLGNEIDVMSRQIFRQRSSINATRKTVNLQALLRQVGSTGDVLSLLQESLTSLSRVISYNQATNNTHNKEQFIHSKMLHRDTLSLNEHATALSQKITFLLDATLGLINLEQNQIIKMFSVAAVVFLPPTLVASVYGMNFKHIPELEWLLGYPWALGLMALSAILPYAFSKKKGWL